MRARPTGRLPCSHPASRPCSSLLVLAATVWAEEKHPAEKFAKSFKADVEVGIKIVNQSEQTMKVFWLDYDGKRVPKGAVKKGDAFETGTYMTHAWLVTDADGNGWYVFITDGQSRTVNVHAPKKK